MKESPSFRDALDSLGVLSAQCGNASIRNEHKRNVMEYLLWAAFWLSRHGVSEGYLSAKEAKQLLRAIDG
tara:strand:- start:1011 stop:1220 length:210 start_codon:yes stop_codon:yes gene_type:complete